MSKVTVVLVDDQQRRMDIEVRKDIVEEKYMVQYKGNLYSYSGYSLYDIAAEITENLPTYVQVRLPAIIG